MGIDFLASAELIAFVGSLLSVCSYFISVLGNQLALLSPIHSGCSPTSRGTIDQTEECRDEFELGALEVKMFSMSCS